jgi:glycerol-3-phosphate dehydrogenase subunit B
MRFDTIIIGGGLSGLVAGIDLVRKGQKCLIVSSGQSALHFFSGSFELYGKEENPLKAIAGLDAAHPYSKLGAERVEALAARVKPFFAEIGLNLKGEASANHWRMTPLGVMKRAWLTLDEYASFESAEQMPWKKVCLLNIDGFLDFHTSYIAASLEQKGVETTIASLSAPQFDKLRENPTEMRSTNISKVIIGDFVQTLAAQINEKAAGAEVVLMPAVAGLTGTAEVERLKELVNVPLYFLPTLPPSTPGICVQMMLKKYFQNQGGVYMLGDSVKEGKFENGKLVSIKTVNHEDTEFVADNFVLASGSFFSKGIVASQTGVAEPIFGFDIDADADRGNWFERNMFEAQPYMKFGVASDEKFRAKKDGQTVENVYVAGSVLSGFNAIKEGCGAGVSILTALNVAESIVEN